MNVRARYSEVNPYAFERAQNRRSDARCRDAPRARPPSGARDRQAIVRRTSATPPPRADGRRRSAPRGGQGRQAARGKSLQSGRMLISCYRRPVILKTSLITRAGARAGKPGPVRRGFPPACQTVQNGRRRAASARSTMAEVIDRVGGLPDRLPLNREGRPGCY